MATLCGACHEAFEAVVKREKTLLHGKHHPNPQSMQAAASEGCSICAILWDRWVSFEAEKRDIGGDTRNNFSWYFVKRRDTSGFEKGKLFFQTLNIDVYPNFHLFALDESMIPDTSGRGVHLPNEITHPDYRVVHRLDPSTGSRGTWLQIQEWIDVCNRHHDCGRFTIPHDKNPKCSNKARNKVRTRKQTDERKTQKSNGKQATAAARRFDVELPARLIDVGSLGDDHDPFLKILDPTEPKVPYVTLSHCWGSPQRRQPPTLTSENFSERKARIPLTDLPKTFADAVKLTRKLGLKYLWIDSLCIIQTSTQDWRTESRKMGGIYANAFCNIAAEAASNCEEGLFLPRGPLSPAVIKVDHCSDGNTTPRSYFLVHEEHARVGLQTSPLRKRAWVCQERLLAPRQISFGSDQVYWSCSDLEACENFPWGFSHSDPHRTSHSFHRLYHDRSLGSRPDPGTTEGLNQGFLLWKWHRAIYDYTCCDLTRKEDKLIALEGLERTIQPHMQDTCIAGLWLRDLPYEMMWRSPNAYPFHPKHGPCFRPRGYRAPSWSWASVEGSIASGGIDIYIDSDRREVSNLTILSTTYRMLDKDIDEHDYTMQAEYGSIRLQGGLVSGYVQGWWSERMRFLHPANASTSLHTTTIRCAIDDARHCRPERFCLLPILVRSGRSDSSNGLILIPILGDCFRRIGTFRTFDSSVNVPISNYQGKSGNAEYARKVELQEISFESPWVHVVHEGKFQEQEKKIITLI